MRYDPEISNARQRAEVVPAMVDYPCRPGWRIGIPRGVNVLAKGGLLTVASRNRFKDWAIGLLIVLFAVFGLTAFSLHFAGSGLICAAISNLCLIAALVVGNSNRSS